MATAKVLVAAFFCLCFVVIQAYIVDPGPSIIATKGEIWPKPKKQETEDTFLSLIPGKFQFKVVNNTCDIIEEAIERYNRIISVISSVGRRSRNRKVILNSDRRRRYRYDQNYAGNLDQLEIILNAPCENLPYAGMDESYILSVNNDSTAQLVSNSVWGILRGIESFSQLLVWAGEGMTLRLNSTIISDEPRFQWRGLLVDTSRHFVNVDVLLQILDGMAYNKLNVFHWHITDDQSFPYQSKLYPELSERGAYHPKLQVYSQNDIAKIIEYARVRGIRVMPEFDTPGHTRSWGVSHPELLTTCEAPYEGKLGPFDPTKEAVYPFMQSLLQEIVDVFPDKYVHLGGDEVGFECWKSNKNITKYMEENRIETFENLEEIYIQKIVNMVDQLDASSIVWQEVYQNGVKLPQSTMVHIWTGDRFHLLRKITADGHPALLSTCWYLDHIAGGGDWSKYYKCDPHDFLGTPEQKKLVLGGEACMWAEVVDNSNIVQRIFPRASAAAEKLWSQYNVNDSSEAARRLEEHYCRMRGRGISAQPPNGPGYCL